VLSQPRVKKTWIQSLATRVMDRIEAEDALRRRRADAPLAERPEPPVVARLIVEIRSDGTHTVARGAMEDAVNGERTTIEAEGGTPLELARSLAGALMTTPLWLGKAASALVRARLKPGEAGARDPD
jgi:hypothetical protein